jgi:hypothetical protein
MAIEPINGANVSGNDYLQKGKNMQGINKAQINNKELNPNSSGLNVNPTVSSTQTDDVNLMANQNKNKDTLDLSSQAKKSYNNQINGPKDSQSNILSSQDKLSNQNSLQKTYSDMEKKI